MRLTILAFVLLPVAAQAQSATDPLQAPQAQNKQSCAVGMVWDQGTQSCLVAEDNASPVQSLPERHNCGGGAPRSVTS